MQEPLKDSKNHKAEGDPKGKNVDPDDNTLGKREGKSTKPEILICGAVGALFSIFGEIFIFLTHAPKLLSCSLLLSGISLDAYCLRIVLANHHLRKYWARFWGVVLLAIGVCLCAVSVWVKIADEREAENTPHQPEPPTFALTIGTALITPDRNLPSFFWLVVDRTAYAIHVLMHAEFTNLKQLSSSVRGYSVETEVATNSWVVMPSVDVRTGRVVLILFGPGGSHGETHNFPDNFNERISNTIVPPGVPVVGWLFLSIPKEGWNKDRLRFRVVYSSGAVDVQPIIFVRTAFDTDFRKSETMALTNEDTSGLQFRRWEDRPAHFN